MGTIVLLEIYSISGKLNAESGTRIHMIGSLDGWSVGWKK